MSSDSNLIAQRYVTAFFDLASEKKEQDNVKKDLLALQGVLSKSVELQKFLVNPVITRKQAQSAITAVLAAIKACDLTQKFFAFVASQRRLAVTAVIIEKYLEQLAASRGELAVQVVSASRLDKKQEELLMGVLAKATGKKIELQLSENPGLIGGVQVRIGSKMLDNSVSGKLERLRLALTNKAA